MCGIVGIYNSNDKPVDAGAFGSMVDALESRGPDGRGVKLLKGGRVCLGHRRLSIIDLTEAGSQPMGNEDGSVWLTFNGEIYNFRSLRQELERHGHLFRSQSDSEAIVHAYEQWGTQCLQRLRGIFAFAIYDCRDGSLFLARDQIGVKPLYYHNGAGSFIFASVPKAILAAEGFRAALDADAFQLYLAYGNLPAQRCIYRGVEKLLPGHYLVVKDGRVSVTEYWRPVYAPEIREWQEALALVRDAVEDAVQAQQVSNVPIGTLLSGGVDSTIITSLLVRENRDLASFTIGFTEVESDERAYAGFAAAALGTRHLQRVLACRDAVRLLPDIVEAYDEPFYLNAVFPYFAVSRLVQSAGMKVVLGGDGADEIFAGYLWHERFRDFMEAKQTPTLRGRLRDALLPPGVPRPLQDFFRYNGFFDGRGGELFLGRKARRECRSNPHDVLAAHWQPEQPPVLAAQLLDFNCFLVDHCLPKVDRASMACGVEVRVPFLDLKLVELVFSIDHALVFRNGERKGLLKQALAHAMPSGMDAGRKKGFSSPVGPWLESGMGAAGERLLLDGSLCGAGVFDRGALERRYAGLNGAEQLLLIGAELWHRRWIENDAASVRDFSSSLDGELAAGRSETAVGVR